MFHKSGSLGPLNYELKGPSRLDRGETLTVEAKVENTADYPRWFRVSAIEGKGTHWLLNPRLGFVDLKPSETRSFSADLGTLAPDLSGGEYILRINISTLGASEAFSYPLQAGHSPIPWIGVGAVLLLAALVVGWRRRRRACKEIT